MQAELDGKILAVIRHRRGVMWCPFCDRSQQDVGGEQFCDGCNAKFVDEVTEIVGDVAPRRRGRSQAVADPDPEEVEAEE